MKSLYHYLKVFATILNCFQCLNNANQLTVTLKWHQLVCLKWLQPVYTSNWTLRYRPYGINTYFSVKLGKLVAVVKYRIRASLGFEPFLYCLLKTSSFIPRYHENHAEFLLFFFSENISIFGNFCLIFGLFLAFPQIKNWKRLLPLSQHFKSSWHQFQRQKRTRKLNFIKNEDSSSKVKKHFRLS